MCGAKTRAGVVGLDGRALYANCKSVHRDQELDSFLKIAHKAGKSVGIVTTTRVTHATPATTYAYSASREWENYDKQFANVAREGCRDIASQLVDDHTYINLNNK